MPEFPLPPIRTANDEDREDNCSRLCPYLGTKSAGVSDIGFHFCRLFGQLRTESMPERHSHCIEAQQAAEAADNEANL